jgi:hypothetical protein
MSVFRAANNINAGSNSAGTNAAGTNPAGSNPAGSNPAGSTSTGSNSTGIRAIDNGGSRPLDPYPINRAREETVPDGPTEPIDDRRRRRRDRLIWLGVLIAILALAVSAVAGLASWRALNVAQRHPAAAVAAPPAAATPDTTDFSVAYAQEPLRVQVGCSAVLFVDLDEPRSNADERVSDLRYDSNCGKQAPRLTLGPGAAGGAQIKDADTDAAGCERAIRTSPLGPGASAEVKKGTVLCVLTAGTPASMALVEVTDVGQTGTAGMRATSWKVTG